MIQDLRTNQNNKESWNNFVLANQGSFLQSFEWGEFQENFGRQAFRFSGQDWQARFFEFTIPVINKKYWYCPRGPVFAGQPNAERLKNFVSTVSEAAKKEKILFFRISPQIANGESLIANLKEAGFKKLNYDVEPSQTQILDISKTEEELLAQMHEKWRYNIRLAVKKGVTVKMISADDSDFEKYFEEFYRLVADGTAARQDIRHHPKEYYRKQLQIKSDVLRLVLFAAEYENKVIAANIVVFFDKTAIYLHGATDNNYRSIMAPHLLQWEQIKEAKKRGCAQYDFWGIVNEQTVDKRGKTWTGFTRFKKGFGGQEVNYVGCWDYPLDKFWCFVYRLAQRIRR